MTQSLLLFHAGRQATKVRFLLCFSALCLGAGIIGFVWIAVFSADPEMSGQEKWLFAFIVLGVGAAFFAGMMVYARLYVVRLWADKDIRAVTIETAKPIGARSRALAVTDFETIAHDPGEMRTYFHRIKTPYLKLRVRGQGLPYVIDLQGTVEDEKAFGRLFRKISDA